MIEETEFGSGLGVIALQLNKPITPQVIRAYHAALERATDADEWAAFSRVAALRFGWQFLPTVPQLHDALLEFRGEPPLQLEATTAYEQVLDAGEYAPEGGTSWTYRHVLQVCGRAAADAFLAAGGHHAFATTWDEEKRRERFVAEYAVVARTAPADRLLPAGAVLALPSGIDIPSNPRLSQDEAEKVIERVRAIAGVEVAPPAPKTVIASDERLAELRRQAAAILEEPAVAPVEEAQ